MEHSTELDSDGGGGLVIINVLKNEPEILLKNVSNDGRHHAFNLKHHFNN